MKKNKPTIFGEESFIIPNLATEFNNQMIEYRNDKFIGKIACEFLLDKDKVKRQLELCSRLENIEKTDLIDMATRKKFADKDYEIKVLQKALELAREFNATTTEQHKQILSLQSQLAEKEKNQNQKALEQLEQIINLFEPYENEGKDTILCANNGISFLEYIDNQIEELKKEIK